MTTNTKFKIKRTFYLTFFKCCYFQLYWEIYFSLFLWLYYVMWWRFMHLQAPMFTNYGHVINFNFKIKAQYTKNFCDFHLAFGLTKQQQKSCVLVFKKCLQNFQVLLFLFVCVFMMENIDLSFLPLWLLWAFPLSWPNGDEFSQHLLIWKRLYFSFIYKTYSGRI